MDGWCEALVSDLEGKEPGLASAMGLAVGMSGQAFEKAMGRFFQWQATFPLLREFQALFSASVVHVDQHMTGVLLPKAEERARYAMEVVNGSMYQLFGAKAIDDGRAASAYGALLDALHQPDDLTIVTTNYDPAAEIGLAELGWSTEDGFQQPVRRTPYFIGRDAIARARGAEKSAAVIHLHGALGWYDAGGRVVRLGADEPYDAHHGQPVVLYPDPDKDPTQNALVQEMWTAFEDALDTADRVVILGHSMHDEPLVDRLRPFGRANQGKLAIGLLRGTARADLEWVSNKIPEADQVGLSFGPDDHSDLVDLEAWMRNERNGNGFDVSP
jgi:hypothetical protein